MRPSRSIAGSAQSSPIRSGDHLLEGGDEAGQIVELDPGLGVGDEGDRDLVDPRIPRERTGGELGQLAVVLPREALADLQDVLLHHVQVVEQPFPGGPDVVVPLRRLGEPVMRVGEDLPGLVQAIQQPMARPRRLCREALAARHGPGLLGQALGAEQLAPDRAREQLVHGRLGRDAGKAAGEGGRQRDARDGGLSRRAVKGYGRRT